MHIILTFQRPRIHYRYCALKNAVGTHKVAALTDKVKKQRNPLMANPNSCFLSLFQSGLAIKQFKYLLTSTRLFQ